MTDAEIRISVLKKIRSEMIRTEGKRTTVYLDSLGNPTVGIGHLVKPEDNLKVGDVISDEQVDALFSQDIGIAIDAAMQQAKEVGQYEEDFVIALTQVNFQLGINWPNEWPNTYNKLKSGDWDGVINAVETSLWAKQTPARTEEFIQALLAEKMEEDTMAEENKTQPVKSGILTSEFWVAQISTVILVIVTFLNAQFDLGLDVADIVMIVLPNMFYILSRLGVKIFNGLSYDQIKSLVEKSVEKNK